MLCKFDVRHIWKIEAHEHTCGVNECPCFTVEHLDERADLATAAFRYATQCPNLSVTYDEMIRYDPHTSEYATIVPARLPSGILLRGIADIVAGYAATYVLTGPQMHRLLRNAIQPRNVTGPRLRHHGTSKSICPLAALRMSMVPNGHFLGLGFISMSFNDSTLRIHLSVKYV